MKYTFCWTYNENGRNRSEGDDEINTDTLEFENDKEALKEVLYTQEQIDEDEDVDNMSLEELEDWAYDIDVGAGSPVVFWVKNGNGKLVYDSGLDPDN